MQSEAWRGHTPSQNKLAIKLAAEGDSASHAQAVQWFREAAAQDDGAACNNLALMYATGKGVTKDLVTAAEWKQRGGEAGAPANKQLNKLLFAYEWQHQAAGLELEQIQRAEGGSLTRGSSSRWRPANYKAAQEKALGGLELVPAGPGAGLTEGANS
jgi:TPR repeat protein